MTRRTVVVSFDWDGEANAAAITFDSTRLGKDSPQYAIENGTGDVIATITFNDQGRLAQIELLDAAKQVPDTLR